MRFLQESDYEPIIQAKEQGAMIKDIAKKFGVCEATISCILAGKHKPRGQKHPHHHRPIHDPASEEVERFEDFSRLPSDVLFKHTRFCDFIG